jgi:NAD(P)H-dependent FMN reductase
MLTMATICAPQNVCVNVYSGLGEMPLFNPDFESNEPFAVAHLRIQIAAADALLIASPEYAHGVSSVIKNALDWMVSSGVFAGKYVVIWNAAPRASHAIMALRETLVVMSARIVDAAGLELQIQPGASEQAPRNPDPVAMRRALQSLKMTLDNIGRE